MVAPFKGPRDKACFCLVYAPYTIAVRSYVRKCKEHLDLVFVPKKSLHFRTGLLYKPLYDSRGIKFRSPHTVRQFFRGIVSAASEAMSENVRSIWTSCSCPKGS